ncbi:hypothetical protein B0I35DRAFT_482297 [Stachybotrys elegans]|uniref:Enterotoxin n=1 Tax=Stachybotrys elegans TaxID=80388 RepID=A0A8K0SND2_9HYPO|nr:hypothetical protein B0I35DRAFT_482297 [Stachybotrys elegans]
MRVHVWCILAYLTAGVLGKGYRVSYEKIMMFYAYRIDQLLPEDQWTIGVVCSQKTDKMYRVCSDPPKPETPKYERPRVKDKGYEAGVPYERPERSWNFNEFAGALDNKKYLSPGSWLLPGGAADQHKLDFDMDQVAAKFKSIGRDQNWYPPWRLFKDGGLPKFLDSDGYTSYDGAVKSVVERVAYAKSNIPSEVFEKNKLIFEKFEQARSKVFLARTANNDYWVKKSYEERIKGIDVKTNSVGYVDFVDGGLKPAFTIDIEATIAANPGIEDLRTKMENVRIQRMIHNDSDTPAQKAEAKAAREHKTVLDIYESAGNIMGATTPGCAT